MFIITTAPEAYDYGYATPVEYSQDILANACKASEDTDYMVRSAMKRGTNVRVVEVPESHVEYQSGRYQSGLYLSIIVKG